MKNITCILAFFVFGIGYAQHGNNQERLDQLPPAVTETQVEHDARQADKERGDRKGDNQEKKQTEKEDNADKKQSKGETKNAINTPDRKSSKTPEKQ